MNPLLIAVIIALIAIISNYVLNQLPALKNFPGKNVYLLRILAGATALTIILGALSDASLAQNYSWLKTGAILIGVFMAIDLGYVVWAICNQGQPVEQGDTEANDEDKER